MKIPKARWAIIIGIFFSALLPFASSVHAASYGYYRTVTVTSTASVASGTNANFPMLVSSTLSSWENSGRGGRIRNLVTAPNGGQEPADLIFSTSTACTGPLNFETESYASSTGALVDWVNVPSLSGGSVIYACYGNVSVTTDQSHPSSTWSSYLAVWHLSQSAANTTVNDSTANKVNGASRRNTGVIATSTLIDGGFLNASANGDYISTTTPINLLTATATISFWYKPGQLSAKLSDLSIANSATSDGGEFEEWINNSGAAECYGVQNGSGVLSPSLAALNTSTWYYAVIQSSPAKQFCSINAGTPYGNVTFNNDGPDHNNMYFGSGYTGQDTALLDEYRVSNNWQSSQWILTEYNNQKSPSTFYALGDEVPVGAVSDALFFAGD